MTPLEFTAQGADASPAQRSATPNVTAEALHSLGVAWKAVFEHRGGSPDGAADARRHERARLDVVPHRPAEPPPPHDSELLSATAARIRSELHEEGNAHLRGVDPRSPPARTLSADGGGEVEPIPTAVLPRTADEGLVDEPDRASSSSVNPSRSQADTGDSVTVAVLDGAIEVVVRDASLGSEAALRQAFEAAELLSGRRLSLRRLTLNGHDVYIRAESASVPTQASLLFCC